MVQRRTNLARSAMASSCAGGGRLKCLQYGMHGYDVDIAAAGISVKPLTQPGLLVHMTRSATCPVVTSSMTPAPRQSCMASVQVAVVVC